MPHATRQTKSPEWPNSPPRTKREAVVLAAAEVFLECGYGAASMDAIAARANVSKATIYAYFPSKDVLFGAVIRERCETHFAEIAAQALDQSDPETGLRAFARNVLDLLLTPESVAAFRVVMAECPRFPELGRIFYESGPVTGMGVLAEHLRKWTMRGQLAVDDPLLAADQFMSMVRGDLHLRRLLGVEDGRDIEETITRAVEVFLRAYRPSRG